MKNSILILSSVFMLFNFSSCKKESLHVVKDKSASVLIPQPQRTAINSQRLTQPGIIYVPLNITLQGNINVYSYVWSQSVDLDQDSLIDFDFKLGIAWSRGADFYQITTSLTATQPGGGIISDWGPTALSGLPPAWLSRPLTSGTVIGSNLATYASPSMPSTYAYSMYFGARKGGTIIGKGDKYVGIKFISGGQTYYGWMRINISGNSRTFIIKDAAFQNNAGASISAGASL